MKDFKDLVDSPFSGKVQQFFQRTVLSDVIPTLGLEQASLAL